MSVLESATISKIANRLVWTGRIPVHNSSLVELKIALI